MMEKRVFLAALLSALFLAWYAQTMQRWARPATPPPQAGSPAAKAQESQGPEAPRTVLQPLADEETVAIDSSSLALEIGTRSGAIRRVVLKNFTETQGTEQLRFGGQYPVLGFRVGETPPVFRLLETSKSSALLSVNEHYHLSLSLDEDNPLVHIILEHIHLVEDSTADSLAVTAAWSPGDELTSRYNSLELFMLAKKNGGKTKHLRYQGPFKTEKIVPRGTMLLALAERYFCQAIQLEREAEAVRLAPSPSGVIAAELRLPAVGSTERLSVYFGPRDFFKLKEAGFDRAFPIGVLGQIGLALLVVLGGLSKLTHNYGLGIILFSGLITGLMAPFTILSYKSMKKMQELKPHIDRLTAKYKSDPQRVNREVFALYKTHRVSPMSGCLPMLLQMPIFIALFQAISHYIDLRGKGFLWIKDLSLPDRLWELPISLPLLGKELNALPIIMAAAMFLQSRMSQVQLPSDQTNPTAKLLSGPLMSVIFCLMFYQFPAGLVLYWLTNSLMSLGLYQLSRSRVQADPGKPGVS